MMELATGLADAGVVGTVMVLVVRWLLSHTSHLLAIIENHLAHSRDAQVALTNAIDALPAKLEDAIRRAHSP